LHWLVLTFGVSILGDLSITLTLFMFFIFITIVKSIKLLFRTVEVNTA
jgi:hypothetical protein